MELLWTELLLLSGAPDPVRHLAPGSLVFTRLPGARCPVPAQVLDLSGHRAPGTSPLEQRGCPGSTCTPGASGPRTSWFLVVRDFPAPDPVYHSYFYLLTTPPGARPVPILE